MTDASPLEIYAEEKQKHEAALAKHRQQQNLYGWLRLAIVMLTAVLAFYLFSISLLWGGFVVVVGLAAFLALVSIDADNNKKIAHLKILIAINQDELDVLAGRFHHRFDGSSFLPPQHAYAQDLDLLGTASLYQYINRSHSEQGRGRLAQNFLAPLPVENILERQEAVKELAPQYKWRQQMQAILAPTGLTTQTERHVKSWMQKPETEFQGGGWKVFINIYSAVMITLAGFAIFGLIPASIFFFLFILSLVFSGYLGRQAAGVNAELTGIVKEVNVMHQLLKWVEEKKFYASLLQQLQQSVSAGGIKAYGSIRELKALLDRFDLRFNWMLFLFLNGFLLWDVRQVRALHDWKKKNRQTLPLCYELVAEMEALNSLATLHFNQPSWTLPVFSKVHFTFSSTGLGHPLLAEQQRVCSDFNICGEARVALITGSNMAGKSTFLRSLGVNVVLAQMGAPVCAASFTLSPNKLMTSMRIADNLAESTSTFYAELKKLKTIIEAVNRKEPVFVLLDEILRGTNSLDKHTGSEALIRQLIRQKAVAVLATHDVALSALENEIPDAVTNYHFDVQVEGDELFFDYKLKPGVCTSLNASILMKKIGIDV